MQEGLVSIIIPTFNRAFLLSETLQSLLVQTYTNWECIIVDDGSTDGTKEMVEKFSEINHKICFFDRPSNRPKGANTCRNFGFEKAKGEFINWFDSDDLMHVDFLSERVHVLSANSDLDFCACLSMTFNDTIDKKGDVEKPYSLNSNNYIEDYLLNGLFFYTPSPLWRYTFLMDKMLFDETLNRSQERDLHFRLLTYKPKFLYLDKVLFYVRVGGSSITTNAKSSLEAQKSIFRYFHKVFNYLKHSQSLTARNKLMAYVFYRQATNYYNINRLCNSWLKRFSILKSLGKNLISYIFVSKRLIKHLPKIFVGLLLVLLSNKGYRYFYFPQYDFTIKK